MESCISTILGLSRLIRQTHSQRAADAFETYVSTDADIETLSNVGRDVLLHLPPDPGACALMSAVYIMRLRRVTSAPTFMVAGTLAVDGTPVFGDGLKLEEALFTVGNSSWDGHAWVMLGNYLADISLCRTAYSGSAHHKLKAYVERRLGVNRGLIISKWPGPAHEGLIYTPQYVLSDEEIERLLRGARSRYSPG